MALFQRRERPPAIAGLPKGERIVSWADTDSGAVVAATPRGLWWPGPDAPRRIAWQHIDKVIWRDRLLAVTEAQVVDDLLLVDLPAVTAVLATPRDLPPVVRKRVEGNIVKTELLTVPGGAVRFVARRRPGHDGLAWWARLEPGTPETDQLRSSIAARLEILRAAS
jgi:hypothetical protein